MRDFNWNLMKSKLVSSKNIALIILGMQGKWLI